MLLQQVIIIKHFVLAVYIFTHFFGSFQVLVDSEALEQVALEAPIPVVSDNKLVETLLVVVQQILVLEQSQRLVPVQQ